MLLVYSEEKVEVVDKSIVDRGKRDVFGFSVLPDQ